MPLGLTGLSGLIGAAAAAREPTFQPYIFWAYGTACALLLLFTLWTIVEVRHLTRKVDELQGRLERSRRADTP